MARAGRVFKGGTDGDHPHLGPGQGKRGGLGGLIFTGLGLNRLDLLLVGGISVALLSLASGAILDGIEKMLTPYLRTAPRRRNIRERKRGII